MSTTFTVVIKGRVGTVSHESEHKIESEKALDWYFRSQVSMAPLLNPGSGFSEGRGGLVFSMRLLKGTTPPQCEMASLH